MAPISLIEWQNSISYHTVCIKDQVTITFLLVIVFAQQRTSTITSKKVIVT